MPAWVGYSLLFTAGMLLANGVPHFIQGISGNRFPTPFASPPGTGESSPQLNVVWGFCNILAALLIFSDFPPDYLIGRVLVGLGILLAGMVLATHFARVRSNR